MCRSSLFSVDTRKLFKARLFSAVRFSRNAVFIALLVACPPEAWSGSWEDKLKGVAGEMLEEGKRAILQGHDQAADGGPQRQSYPESQQQPQFSRSEAKSVQPYFGYDTKEQIREIQTYLRQLGYNPGPADGIFGRRTAKAIAQFEIDQGLAVTAQPSQNLVNALQRARLQETPSRPADVQHPTQTVANSPAVQAAKQCINTYTSCRKQSLAAPQACMQQYGICMLGERSVSDAKTNSATQQESAPAATAVQSPTIQKNKLPPPDPLEEVKQVAMATAQALNNQKDGSSIEGESGELPKINRNRLEPVRAQHRQVITNNPSGFFWNSMGNQLAQGVAGAVTIRNIEKEIRRHVRNLEGALKICCSCPYREVILDEFVKWKGEQLWNEQVVANVMGTLRGNTDLSRLVPSRDMDRQTLIAMAPKPCWPPGEIPEPTVQHKRDGGVYRIVNWGLVPDGFRVPTPPAIPTRGRLMYSAHIQIPGRLRSSLLSSFYAGSLPGYFDLKRAEQARVDEDARRVQSQDAYILRCYYLRKDYLGATSVWFWYRARPEGVSRRYLSARLPDHSLLQIRGPVERCPADLDSAQGMPF